MLMVFGHRITETLTPEVLAMLKAPPKPDYPVLSPFDIGKFDAYMFGRYSARGRDGVLEYIQD